MARKNLFSTAALFLLAVMASGMCELTNQRTLGIQEGGGLKETGPKTKRLRQRGNTALD